MLHFRSAFIVKQNRPPESTPTSISINSSLPPNIIALPVSGEYCLLVSTFKGETLRQTIRPSLMPKSWSAACCWQIEPVNNSVPLPAPEHGQLVLWAPQTLNNNRPTPCDAGLLELA